MSYQVLARKWRPRSFRETVGQEHVLKALINALDHNRLHHAYLFTGTRGVGKTTIARILAKCLNCEVGVSSEPCGQCSACCEIAEGRFVDLIEVDAASRTKVEDTRELLDNVQYAPTRGRYKIYLIDEVHMLSNHSFNALLKTLEEPPEHVKFLLATTDPQKLPVTILSRCLQFNLKNMSPERIVEHLSAVLGQEMVPFDELALWQLARSADGSMRDALSLTDQAIAFGNGKVADADVTAMLGTIDHSVIENVLQALAAADTAALLRVSADFAQQSPDYDSALADLTTALHRIAIAQAVPEALDNRYGDREQILQLARSFAPEDVQLFYQCALVGRRDLHLAPEGRGGFEMVLLRMLVFKPQGVADVPSSTLPQGAEQPSVDTPSEASAEAAGLAPAPDQKISTATIGPGAAPAGPSSAKLAPSEEQSPAKKFEAPAAARNAAVQNSPRPGPVLSEPIANGQLASENRADLTFATGPVAPPTSSPMQGAASQTVYACDEDLAVLEEAPPAASAERPQHASTAVVSETGPRGKMANESVDQLEQASEKQRSPIPLADFVPQRWFEVYRHLNIKGVLQSTASNLVLEQVRGSELYFKLDENKASLFDERQAKRLSQVFSEYFAQTVQAHVTLGAIADDQLTPAMVLARWREQARDSAIERLQNDPVAVHLQRDFDARLDLESVEFSLSDREPNSVK